MSPLDEQLAELADHLNDELVAHDASPAPGGTPRRGVLTLAAAVVLVAGIAGVAYVAGNERDTTPAEPSAASTAPISPTVAASAQLERDAYEVWTEVWSLAPYDELNRWREAIIEHYRRECMQAAGFTYVPYPYVSSATSPATSVLAPLPTVDDARVQGYDAYPLVFGDAGNPSEAAAWEQAEAANNSAAAQSPGWTETLRDSSADGPSCSAQAEAQLASQVDLTALTMWSDAADQQLLPPSTAAGYTAEPLATARGAWVSCMAARGYAYSDPTEPQLEYQGAPSADPAAEIGTAVADTECRAAAGYRDALLETVTAIYRDWLETNASFVDQMRSTTAAEAAAVHNLATQLGIG